MIDNNKVVDILRKVVDPNTGQDIISLKRVENLKIDGNNVSFTVQLDSTDQNAKTGLYEMIQGLFQQDLPEAQIHIQFNSNAPTGVKNPLPHIKNIIAVASGKGGVGKSTVAANLALALKEQGARVGLIDADLYGPSMPTMFGLKDARPQIQSLYGKNKMIPIEKYGIHLISIGFIIAPEQAVVLRGPRLGGIIKQFVQEVIWPELDYLIIDLPPGTGDIQLTLVQTVPVTGAVIVTTPQELAVVDAIKAMNMFLLDNVNVPIIGVVENMSWFTPADMPNQQYFLFGKGGGKKLAKFANTVMLGQIPLVQSVGESGDSGIPVVMDKKHHGRDFFLQMAKRTIQQVNLRNEMRGETEMVKITT